MGLTCSDTLLTLSGNNFSMSNFDMTPSSFIIFVLDGETFRPPFVGCDAPALAPGGGGDWLSSLKPPK